MLRVLLIMSLLLTPFIVLTNPLSPDEEISMKEDELNSKKQQIKELGEDIKRLQAEEAALKSDKTLTSQEKERKSKKLKQLIKDKTYLKNNLQWWVSQAEGVEDNLAQKRRESTKTQTDFDKLKNDFENEFIDLFFLNIPQSNNDNIRKKILLKSLMSYQEDVIFNLDTNYLQTQNVIKVNEGKLSDINDKIESKQKQQSKVDKEYREYKQVTEELETKIANLSSQEAKVLQQRKQLIADKEKLEREALELENFIEEIGRAHV